ncbi:MAG: tetratricopeptide repeat protein, partial [Gammaproteobacteria bacterium]|nr:tetratricopeptide repeat protein [Gammaproteobacteria bacterium]MBU1554285.1 tetratricopeptide repeat protein [Gammaproteobacteria bacterium]
MPRITALLLLLFSLNTLATDTLQTRLTEAGNNAEQVSNALLSMPADNLTTEDWLVLTEAQRRLRNKEAALDAVNRALQSSRQPFLQAQAYLLKAQVYGILYRDTAIAITQLELAERLVQQAEDNDSLTLYSEVLQSFAQAYNQLGDVTRAIPYAEKSLALAVRQQQAEAELSARIILGRLTLQNNAYGQAHQHLQHALALATRLNNTDALASIHFRLGMAYRKINDHVQALQHLQHAKQY